jgi:Spy/CpxP family protein refolding chaperone
MINSPSEKPMKLMALSALIVMFLMGGVVGSLAMNWYNRTHPVAPAAGGKTGGPGHRGPGFGGPGGGPGGPAAGPKIIERFQKELDLNDQQTAQVKDILMRTQDQFMQLRNESRPKYIAIREQSEKDIKAILTPEQQAKLEAWFKREGDRERERGDRGDRGDRADRDKEGSQRPH